jgi:hypothetical protein
MTTCHLEQGVGKPSSPPIQNGVNFVMSACLDSSLTECVHSKRQTNQTTTDDYATPKVYEHPWMAKVDCRHHARDERDGLRPGPAGSGF